MDFFTDEFYMKEALKEAVIALGKDEIPIGAIVVAKNRIIARAHNLTETLNDTTAHAEMQAITSATNFVGGKYLKNITLYVTLEPCVMCAGALFWSKISRIVFGAYDSKQGYSVYNKILNRENLNILHPKTEIIGGIMENECSQLIKDFFNKKREQSF